MTALKWHEGHMVAYDVETTGVNVHEDRIVTAAIVHKAPGERPRTITWVIDPDVPIPTEASDVHGWTHERIRHHLGPQAMASSTVNGRTTLHVDPGQAIYEIAGQVALAMSQGVPVVAMNASFDLTILEAECARHGHDTLTQRLAPKGIGGVIDPMILDKQHDPYRPGKCDGQQKRGPKCRCGADGKKLVDLCRHYGVLLGDAHAADADALAALRLVPRLVAAWPELGRWRLSTVHEKQIGWKKEQAASLASYFRRIGEHEKAETVSGEWPLQTSRVKAVA